MKLRSLILASVVAVLPFAAQVAVAREDSRANIRASRGAPGATAADCTFHPKKSITLDRDIGPCTFGIQVEGVQDITIDLNGHTISGYLPNGASQWGIEVFESSNIRIKGPGTIRGFNDNVIVEDSRNVTVTNVTSIDFWDEGIQFIDSSNSVAKRNTVRGDGDTGISVYSDFGDGRSTRNAVIKNDVSGDLNILIDVGPQLGESHVDSRVSKTRVIGNTLHDGTHDGIQLRRTTGNQVEDNQVIGVGANGIDVVTGSSGNSIIDNTVSGSGGVDLRDEGADCPNTWKKNTFGTKQPACIR